MSIIRRCRREEAPTILAIINAAAQRYRGTIPADCWHEPYMTEGHGYALSAPSETPALLDTYWNISPRQAETSVVLAKDPRQPSRPRVS